MMQMKIVITLHVYLLHCLNCIYGEKAKKLQKITSMELNLKSKEDSTSSLLYIYSKLWGYA